MVAITKSMLYTKMEINNNCMEHRVATVIKSIGIAGLNGYRIDVEVSVFNGVAMTSIVGLGDAAVKEARDRIETCINQMELTYPKKKVVINLSPSDMKKSGTYFDLPMIIGILMESDQLDPVGIDLDDYILLGEIGLNGGLRSFNGVLPMIIAAKRMGYRKIVLPEDCLQEASLVVGMELFAFESLRQVITFFESKGSRVPSQPSAPQRAKENHVLDFADVRGHRDVLDYVVAAVAGNHNMLMIGAPGCGKSMIAKRMPTILPDMTEDEVLEVTSIYSVSGLLKENRLIENRPFRSPHYNASANALIGGGMNALPGEISFAHNGILFLDELPEFSRRTLESLRQPLEDREVTISRVKQTNTFPANFQLVAAMNPCPCGNLGSTKCHCSDYDIKRYTQRISGPILDRIDIQKYMGKVDLFAATDASHVTGSSQMRDRVANARKAQLLRFSNANGVTTNSQMETAHIKEFCPLSSDCLRALQRSYEKYNFSARTYNKIIKIARTFADLDSAKEIGISHMIAGLMARDLDKEKNTMVVAK